MLSLVSETQRRSTMNSQVQFTDGTPVRYSATDVTPRIILSTCQVHARVTHIFIGFSCIPVGVGHRIDSVGVSANHSPHEWGSRISRVSALSGRPEQTPPITTDMTCTNCCRWNHSHSNEWQLLSSSYYVVLSLYVRTNIITARCYAERGYAMASCPSVRQSVCL